MGAFAGLGKLLRLALRRDRIKFPLTALALGLTFLLLVAGVVEVYGSNEAERATYAATSAVSAVSRAFNGPVLGSSLGSVAFTETFTFFAIFAMLVITLLVIRHTRQNEEMGRTELLGATVVGRQVPLTAALLLAFSLAILIGVAVTLSYVIYGLPFGGSLLAGASMALLGIVFAGIAAITAQLTRTARAANGLAAASIGVAFVVRVIGDIQGEVQPDGVSATSGWLSWLSPIGLARATRPFAENHWWILIILALLAIAFTAFAYWLASRRDLGSGLLPARAGRTHATKGLLSSFGLASRLQRGVWLGWAVGIALLAFSLGVVTKEVGDFTASSEQTAQIVELLGGTENLIDAYLSFSLLLFGVAAAAYAIQAALRLRAEEAAGHLEILLSTRASRTSTLLSHIAVISIGLVLLLFLAGAVTGLAYGATIQDPWGEAARLLGATMAYLPSALLFLALTIAVLGIIPTAAIAAAWLLFAASYIILQFGQILNLPEWLMNLSPFTHIPQLPAADFELLPLIVMFGIAVVIGLFGLWRYTDRDISA